MSIAICILAKDEAGCISDILAQLARQSLISGDQMDVDIHVVANGCSDDTVALALTQAALFHCKRAELHVHDIHPAGKSRSWNIAVHELVDPSAEIVIFIDADITLIDDQVLGLLLASLEGQPTAEVCSGFPVKDISAKPSKSPLDRFSLKVSEHSRYEGAINGSLYVAKGAALREIWLPNQTPGEDGFLNALLVTRGFTEPPDPKIVISADQPTHYYKSHRPFDFFLHERRMIVGTMINIWIFEHLWSLKLTAPAGLLIRDWNGADPKWVEKLVERHARNQHWLVRNAIMFRRFTGRAGKPLWKRAAYVPIATAATILTLPAAVAANRRLKALGAADTW